MKVSIDMDYGVSAVVTSIMDEGCEEMVQLVHRALLAVGFQPHSVAEAFLAVGEEHLANLGAGSDPCWGGPIDA